MMVNGMSNASEVRLRRTFERVQILWMIAVVGGIAAASMFAVVLAVSRNLSAAAVAALPVISAIVALVWAAVAHGRLGSRLGRALAALSTATELQPARPRG
jgi:hypothetical protein